MNELSYSIENVEVSDGEENYIRECVFYLVDGKKLDFEDFIPINYLDVLEEDLYDESFDNKKMVLINCCSCGIWSCDGVVAAVTEKPSSVMWQIHRVGVKEILATYEFEKENYNFVMEQMKKVAEEKVKAAESWKK